MKTLTLIAALCAAPAVAQDAPCLQRGDMMAALEDGYGEVSVGYGYDPRGAVVEVYVSEFGTWSLVITGPDGVSCIPAAGTDWVFVEQPWPKLGEEH